MHHWIWGILFSDKRHVGLQSRGPKETSTETWPLETGKCQGMPSSFINPQLEGENLFAAKNAQAYSYLVPPSI